MNELLSKLKGIKGLLINIDLRNLKSIKLVDIQIGTKTYVQNGDLHINLAKITQQEKQKLTPILEEEFNKDEIIFLEEDAKKVVDQLRKIEKSPSNVIKFFSDKIPNSDLQILKAAEYIKTVTDRREIYRLKGEISLKSGIRGSNIVKLYTAGYFESILIPLYDHLSSQEGFTKDKFLHYYNKIVSHITFAIFVKRTMSKKDLYNELKRSIRVNKSYGIDHLNIHGVGSENVSKILEVLPEIKELLSKEPEIESSNGIMAVTIWF